MTRANLMRALAARQPDNQSQQKPADQTSLSALGKYNRKLPSQHALFNLEGRSLTPLLELERAAA